MKISETRTNFAIKHELVCDVMLKLLAEESRDQAFKYYSYFIHELGIISCALFEVSIGSHFNKPILCKYDKSGDNVSWTDHYSLMQYHEQDVLFDGILKIPQWQNISDIRSNHPFSRAIEKDMADYGLFEGFVTSTLTDMGTIAAIVLHSDKSILSNLDIASVNTLISLSKLVLSIRPLVKDKFNISAWPSPGTKFYQALNMLANGASNGELCDELNISDSMANEYSRICKRLCSEMSPYNERIVSRGEIARFLTKAGFGDKFNWLQEPTGAGSYN